MTENVQETIQALKDLIAVKLDCAKNAPAHVRELFLQQAADYQQEIERLSK
jgi:hypothetical protein